MDLNAIHRENYPRVELETAVYWKRFGGPPDLRGKRVLDFGCGLGKLSVDLARAGAEEVVGLDVDESAIDFARQYTQERFPDVADRIRFECIDIADAPQDSFDAIFSKDAFEHIQDIEGTFTELRKHVGPGGRIYLGFGPLWHSPYGAHGIAKRLRTLGGHTIPWAHLLIPEKVLVSEENKARNKSIGSIRDYGLNQLPLSAYKRVLLESGMRVLKFDTNPTDSRLARLFRPAEALPHFGKYFVRTVYCILENV